MRNGPIENAPKSPCYMCDDRQHYCHMVCARYAEFRASIDQAEAARRKAVDLTSYQLAANQRRATRK